MAIIKILVLGQNLWPSVKLLTKSLSLKCYCASRMGCEVLYFKGPPSGAEVPLSDLVARPLPPDGQRV